MAPAIEDYALIGDCHSAALVSRDGSIDWLCWPRFDSGACFARLLGDSENGRWLLGASDPDAKVTRSYRDRTLTLETRIETKDGTAIVLDFMPAQIPGSHVVRIVRGIEGTVRMRTEFIIRYDYGAVVPWVRRHEDGSLHAVAGPDRAVLRSAISLEPSGRSHAAEFSVPEGAVVAFTLSYAASYQEPPQPVDPHAELERTEKLWRGWAENLEGAGPWTDIVMRSLLTLRALIYQPSGAIVAAPTTSLPEYPGGNRNWDYRFCWLRDATFTLFSLMNAGATSEAKNWRTWLLRAIGGDAAQVQILYGIGGERRAAELTLPWLAGFGGAQPVRVGNGAAGQLQLDIYGEVLDALYQSRKRGLVGNDNDWMVQLELLKHLETVWNEPDQGIWEMRSGPRHFTYSKVMVWVAFDRAVKSIEEFGLEGPLDHWRALRQRVHDDICTKAFNAELGTFTQSYGSRALDASLLLMGLVGFLPLDDKRLRNTVEAIERDLMQDGFVMRYRSEAVSDGLPAGEAAFLACSFWLADNLVLMGRRDDAIAMFERLLLVCNDLGLMAEEYNAASKTLAGNFPQAFSHIALVNTAYNLARSGKPAEQRSGYKTSR